MFGLAVPGSSPSVIGISDEYRGQSPKAFIALKRGAEPFHIDELKEFLRDKLGKHEMVAHIEFREALPKTAVGKILKTTLYEEEAQRRAGATAQVCALRGRKYVVVDCRDGPGPFRITSDIGVEVPIPWTASGRLLVGHMSDAEIRDFIAPDWRAQAADFR